MRGHVCLCIDHICFCVCVVCVCITCFVCLLLFTSDPRYRYAVNGWGVVSMCVCVGVCFADSERVHVGHTVFS